MHPTDLHTFGRLLMGLGETYGKSLSPTAVEIYWRALERYALEEVKRAIDRHLTHPDTGPYWPKPADLIRHLGGGTTQDRAARAWAKVERELRRVGAYASVVFDDPLVMMTLADLGGWPTLCHAALEALPFRAKDFKALYAAYAVQPKAEYPRVLPGLAEQHNTANGLPAPPPVLLGDDKAAALTVYQSGKDLGAIAPPLWESGQLLAAVSAPATPSPALSPPTRPAPLTVQAPARVEKWQAAIPTLMTTFEAIPSAQQWP